MAYGFGTGVQAGLGATDYSNYLRGALSGAQMSAQGTAAIGQGIQNALGYIGEGIKKYQENKIISSKLSAENDRKLAELLKIDPMAVVNADEKTQKIFGKMQQGKGVSIEELTRANAWLGDAVSKGRESVELNALKQAFSQPDATAPDMVKAYLDMGGNRLDVVKGIYGGALTSAQIAESEARTNAKGYVAKALNAYSGAPTAATPTATPGYGANQTTFTEGPRGRSINIGPLSTLPQPQVQGQDNDPFAKRDRGLAAAGANPDAISAVEGAFDNELKVLVPQAVTSILEDINSGGTGDAIPAGMSEGVYSLALQDRRVDAAIKEARTEARINKIAKSVEEIGSGKELKNSLADLAPADRLEVLKQVREFYPQMDMQIVAFGGQQYVRIGGKLTPLNEKAGLNVDVFSQGLREASYVAREAGDTKSFGELNSTQQQRVVAAFFKALGGGGRDSVGPNMYEEVNNFYNQALIAAGDLSKVKEGDKGSGDGGASTGQPPPSQPAAAQPAATADADRPGIEQGFFRPPSYSDTITITNITKAPTVPGEPSPGQFSSDGLTAPPIETSVSATGEPWTGAADSGVDVVNLVQGGATALTAAEIARRGAVRAFKSPTVQEALKPAERAMRRLPIAKRELGRTIGRTTLRRAGLIGAATVAIDDILGMGATFIANQARKAEGQELRDYNAGLVELTMEKLGELSVDPRGEQVIKGRILDEIESIQRSRVNDREADAEKNAKIRYLLQLSSRINEIGFRSGEGKKYSR